MMKLSLVKETETLYIGEHSHLYDFLELSSSVLESVLHTHAERL